MDDYKYTIFSHGEMNYKDTGDKREYYSFLIPEDVEIYTFTDIGTQLMVCYNSLEHICGFTKKTKTSGKNDILIWPVNLPLYKFKQEPGQNNKFPNIYLSKDDKRKWNSGIVYCQNPEEKHRVIYNIDADPKKKCDRNSIVPDKYNKLYSVEKNYTKFYNDVLKEDNSMCGGILLSDAIQLIKQHYKSLSGEEKSNKIKIFLHSCLSSHPFNSEERFKSLFKESKIFKESKNPTTTSFVDSLKEYLFKPSKNPTTYFVDSLDDFKPIKLTPSTKQFYSVIINNINFIIITKKKIFNNFDTYWDTHQAFLENNNLKHKYYFGFTAPTMIKNIIEAKDFKDKNATLPTSVFIDVTEENIEKKNEKLYNSVKEQIYAATKIPNYIPFNLWQDE